jgi:hypothetical protein
MADKKINIKSPTPSVNSTVTSKGNLSPKVSRVLNDVANVAALTPLGRDLKAAVGVARAGADAVASVTRRESGRMAAAAAEKPYAKSIKGVQGQNANLTTTRGSVKESPATNTKINLQKVVNPTSAKNMAAKQTASDARVAAVKTQAAADNKTAMGNLKRTGVGTAAAAGLNTARLSSDRTANSTTSLRQAGTALNSATKAPGADYSVRSVKQ